MYLFYGRLRPYLNKVCMPDFDGICSTDILVFPRAEAVDNRLLMRFLATPTVVDYATHHSAGVQLPRVSFEKLAELEFPLAPLTEQKRIAAMVDDLLLGVSASREQLARVSAILKRLRHSVLAAACSGRLTKGWRQSGVPVSVAASQGRRAAPEAIEGRFDLPETWTWLPAGEAYLGAGYGTSVKCERSARGGVPVLRVPNIAKGRLDVGDLKYAPKGAVDAGSLLVRHGDLLVCRTNGSLDLVGKVAVVPELQERFSFASYLIRLRMDDTILLPEYFHSFLSAPIGRDQIEEKARTTAGQFNLNLEILRNLAVPVPPLAEQREIVRRVGRLFNIADAVEKHVAGAKTRAERLTQAILAKAFRGELVPTEAELARREGRAYEPAVVLLERIRANRVAGREHAPQKTPARPKQRGTGGQSRAERANRR